MTVKDNIEKKLRNQLEPTLLKVIDESHLHAGHSHSRPEGETHFRIQIASPDLASMSRVAAHRAVHSAIREELSGPVHALSLEIIRPS